MSEGSDGTELKPVFHSSTITPVTSSHNHFSASSAHIRFTPSTLSLVDVSYTVIDRTTKKDRVLLHPLHAVAPAGQSLAVMGPSGCGKSTLLEVMGNRLASGRVGGRILRNGVPVRGVFRRHIKFVPQIDVLPAVFSCDELLYYAAQLSLPSTMSEKEKREEIENCLSALGLLSCRSTKVGNIFYKGLSGGQIKRLAIAIELIGRPSTLLLDEPTSGLDSKAALSLCMRLKSLTSMGHSVVLSIHQPSAEIMSNFDNVLLLARGLCVYNGPVNQLRGYFDALSEKGITSKCPQYTNPFDHVIYLINDDFDDGKTAAADLDVLHASYLESEMAAKANSLVQAQIQIGESASNQTHHHHHLHNHQKSDNEEEEEETYATSLLNQTSVLLHRQFIASIRDFGFMWVRMAVMITLAILVGTIYHEFTLSQRSINNRIGCLFVVNVFMSWMVLGASIFFVDSRRIFARERANGLYSTFAHVAAVSLNSFFFVFVMALIIASVIYPVAGLNDDAERFGWYLLQLYLTFLSAEYIALSLSAVFNHAVVIVVVLSGWFGTLVMVQGYTVLIKSIPWYWRWISYIGQFTYAFRIMMNNEFKGMVFDVPFQNTTFVLDSGVAQEDVVCPIAGGPVFRTGEQVLDFYNMTDTPKYEDVLVLAALAIAYLIIYTVILHFFVKGKK